VIFRSVAEGTPAELAKGRTPTGRVIADLIRTKPARKDQGLGTGAPRATPG